MYDEPRLSAGLYAGSGWNDESTGSFSNSGAVELIVGDANSGAADIGAAALTSALLKSQLNFPPTELVEKFGTCRVPIVFIEKKLP